MLDKAAAIAAYARQRKDVEVDVWMTEIRRRAEVRIGELSRDLEKAQRGDGPAGAFALPDGRKSKTQALADAGISTSTAHEYEQLTGGADARGEAAARAAEVFFAKARAVSAIRGQFVPNDASECLSETVRLRTPRLNLSRI